MILSSVVFPQPLGPRMTSVSPSKMLRLRSSMRNGGRAAAATECGTPAALTWPAPCGVAEMLIRSIRAMAPLPPDVRLQGIARRQGQLAPGGLRSAEPRLGEARRALPALGHAAGHRRRRGQAGRLRGHRANTIED